MQRKPGIWRRILWDSVQPQFKTILYLTDANKENSAFEYHRLKLKIHYFYLESGHKISSRRFSDEFIASNFENTSILEGVAGDQLFVK